jgi:hypothetical protein
MIILLSFWSTLKRRRVRLWDHQSVCLCCSSLIIFNQLVEFHEIHQKAHAIEGDLDATIFITCRSLNHSKMDVVRTSEVDIKFAPVSVRLWRVKFGNHDNQTIFVSQFKLYLFNNGSRSWTHCLITVTMVSDVTKETKVRSIPSLNSATDSIVK